VIAMNACVSGEEFLDALKPRNETGRRFKNLDSNGGNAQVRRDRKSD